jgi:protein O-mannosyl-transferase
MTDIQNFFKNLWNRAYVKQGAIILALCLISFLCYYPASKNNFLIWDDGAYVKDNPDIQKINYESVKLFFTKSYVKSYVPITMLSYAFNYMIDGMNPKVYIFTNIILHLFNSILVFWLILGVLKYFENDKERKTVNNKNFAIAAITSILFLIHPIQVESVAWIAERKNVLYSFFYLSSILLYIKYITSENKNLLALSLFLFIFSLLSKGTAVSLPLSIISIDYLFGRKLLSKKVILEKVPYLILSLIIGIIAISRQGNQNIVLERTFPEQIACASYAFFSYIIKLIIPFNLYTFYPFPKEVSFIYWMSLILFLVFFALIIFFRKRISRIIMFGILFFLTNIIFMLQIIPDWDILMADRYAYLPSIGFFLVTVILILKVSIKFRIIVLVFPVAIVLFGFTTFERVKVWNNNYSLWDDVIKKNKFVPVAWNNRGLVKRDSGNYAGAYVDFSSAIKVKPDFREPYNNRGIVNAQLGHLKEAMSDFNRAIEIDPAFAMAYYNRGKLKKINKDYKSALDDLNLSIKLDPKYTNALFLRARLYCNLGLLDNALRDCDSALVFDINSVNVHILKAGIYYKTFQFQQSIDEADRGLLINSNKGTFYYIKSLSNLKLGNKSASNKDLLKAKSLGFVPEKDGLVNDLGISSDY